MALKYGFFDSEITGYDTEGMPIFDRAQDSEFLSLFISKIVGDGVLATPSNSFQVIASTGMTVTVKAGSAFIKGRFVYDNSDNSLIVEKSPSSFKRVDAVILRANFLKRTFEFLIRPGSVSATAQAPSLFRPTSGGDYFELCLAEITVNSNRTNITQSDIRDTRHIKTLCGICHGAIEQMDFTSIRSQFDDYYRRFADEAEGYQINKRAEFESWFRNLNSGLQSFISSLQEGRDENLFLNSKDFSGEWLNASNGTKAEIYKGLVIQKITSNISTKTQQFSVKKGEKYTFSFYAKGSLSSVGVNCVIYTSRGSSDIRITDLSSNVKSMIIGDSYERYSVTFDVLNSCDIQPRLEKTGNGELFFGGFKLQFGGIPTSWTANALDLFYDIDSYKSKVEEKINGISESDGINLLKGSRDFSGDWNISKPDIDGMINRSFFYNGVYIISHTNSTFKVGQRIQLESGKWYTFSFYGKVATLPGTLGVYFRFVQTSDFAKIKIPGTSGAAIRHVWSDVSTEIKRYSISFYCEKEGYIEPYIDVGLNSGTTKTVFFGGFKLENGFKATPWSLNPDELLEDIDNVKTRTPGMNLLKGTQSFSGSWFDNSGGVKVKELVKASSVVDGFTILKHSTNWLIVSQQIRVKKGEKYTFSFLGKTEATTGSIGIRLAVGTHNVPNLRLLSDGSNGLRISLSAKNVLKRYSVSFEVLSDGVITPTIEPAYNVASDKTLYFGAFKLERGTRATDWIPNPMDGIEKTSKKLVDGWLVTDIDGVKLATKSLTVTGVDRGTYSGISVFESKIQLPTGVFTTEPSVTASVDQVGVIGYIYGVNVTFITTTGASVYWSKSNGTNGEVDIKLIAMGV